MRNTVQGSVLRSWVGTRKRPFACLANLRGLPVLRQGTASERYHTSGLRGAGAGAFVGPDGKSLPVPEDLPNAHMRLFGGAQYHRAMAEFRSGIGALTCPDISREEIVNACGIDDFHDGVNYTRTACVIAVSKARDTFEPFLHQARPIPYPTLPGTAVAPICVACKALQVLGTRCVVVFRRATRLLVPAQGVCHLLQGITQACTERCMRTPSCDRHPGSVWCVCAAFQLTR